MRRAAPLPTPAEGLALCEFLYLDGTGLRLMRHLLPEGASLADALSFRDSLKRLQRRPSRCLAEQDEPLPCPVASPLGLILLKLKAG